MTNDADLQPAVAAEFQALAGLLESATGAQWDTPSLCAGWRVGEVIAHMTMAARYSEEEFTGSAAPGRSPPRYWSCSGRRASTSTSGPARATGAENSHPGPAGLTGVYRGRLTIDRPGREPADTRPGRIPGGGRAGRAC
jgi:uncharacterized protein (TIGR03083 family)